MVASLFYLCHTRRCACSSAGCSGPGTAGGGQQMILGSEIVNGFDSAWNLPSLPFMPDFKVINMNSNIDDCCYMPADTISDSDV